MSTAAETDLSAEIARACASFSPRRASVEDVASRLGLSRRGLHDRCRRLLGQSARAAIDAWLLSQAQQLLRYSEGSLEQIAADLGFADGFAFSRFFRRHSGGPAPGRWRRLQRSSPRDPR
ncbi:MAG: helix-turn-helix transcriptional regulator [Planctomycetota bacterium]